MLVLPLGSIYAKSANTEPIKIGVLVPLTGVFAESGHMVELGLKMAFDEVGYQVCGREVKLIIEDNEGKAATVLTKAKTLVESDKVTFLCGKLAS